MSVDPYLIFLCGINDAAKDDPRFDWEIANKLEVTYGSIEDAPVPVLSLDDDEDEFWDEFCSMPTKHIDSRPPLHSAFYEGNPSQAHPTAHGDQPTVGYIIESVHNQDLLRALSLVPGFSKIMEGSVAILPSMTMEGNELKYGLDSSLDREGVELAIKEGRWIKYYPCWVTNRWFNCAIHVMHFAGWTGVTRNMLKLMVVFDWA